MQHSVTCVDRESNFLGRHLSIPFCLTSISRNDCWASPNDEDYRSDVFLALESAALRVLGQEFAERDQAAFFLASASTSTPIMSLSFIMRYSTPSILTSVPDHLPNRMRSSTLTSIGMSLPLSSRPPGPTAD